MAHPVPRGLPAARIGVATSSEQKTTIFIFLNIILGLLSLFSQTAGADEASGETLRKSRDLLCGKDTWCPIPRTIRTKSTYFRLQALQEEEGGNALKRILLALMVAAVIAALTATAAEAQMSWYWCWNYDYGYWDYCWY